MSGCAWAFKAVLCLGLGLLGRLSGKRVEILGSTLDYVGVSHDLRGLDRLLYQTILSFAGALSRGLDCVVSAVAHDRISTPPLAESTLPMPATYLRNERSGGS
jgi:hypothetical protein